MLMASSVWFLMASLSADEPIMNMMPRWDDGWGYQFIEYRHESDLLLGSRLHPGYTEDVHLLHFRRLQDKSSALESCLMCRRPAGDAATARRKRIEHDVGIGDATPALPLKKYFNLDGKSGSWTSNRCCACRFRARMIMRFTTTNGATVSAWDMNTRPLNFTCVSRWLGVSRNEPFESWSTLDLGYNFNAWGTNAALMWETDFHYEDDGSETLLAGPALYWNINDTAHFRIEWKHYFHDRQGVLDHGNGDVFKFSLGFVF